MAPGQANLRRSGGLGLLEAGSDVFPNDPRPVAFALDARFRDAEIARSGSGPGVVVRRVAPRAYYAALYASDSDALTIVRRAGDPFVELARTTARPRQGALTLALSAAGRNPTLLTARLNGTYTLIGRQPGAWTLVRVRQDDGPNYGQQATRQNAHQR